MPTQKNTDKAEEYRLISKEHVWLSKHYRRLYELEMQEKGLEPKEIEDKNQTKINFEEYETE